MRATRAVAFLLIVLVFASGALSSPPLKADRVVVYKKDRVLVLLNQGKEIKRYKIALGRNPVGRKVREGDHKTPEGNYVLDWRKPKSQFYKALHISYPNAQDIAGAKKLGVPPGGSIFLHGLPNGFAWLGASHRLTDWTNGCIAVTNEELEEIWALVADGTPIEIKP